MAKYNANARFTNHDLLLTHPYIFFMILDYH